MKKKIKSIAVSAIVILLAVTMASAVTMSVDELKELMSFGNFGALSSETAVNTDADETTNFNDIRADDIEVEDDLFVGGDLTVTGDTAFGGLTQKVVTGSCADATTTPIAIANPFTSTSSVIYFQYNSQGSATSTYSMDCGVAAGAFTSSDDLIDGLSVSTSTQAWQMNPYGTNGKANVNVDVGEYLTCTLSGSITAGITNAGNTYTCTYKAIFVQ